MSNKLIDKYLGRFLIWEEGNVYIIIDQKDGELLNRWGWCGYVFEDIEKAIQNKLKLSPLDLLNWISD